MSPEDFEEESSSDEGGAPAWMATFSDMATLLLTFFVLLLSFANMDVQNFRVALGSVKEALGVQFTARGDFEARSTTPVELSTEQATPDITKARDPDITLEAEEVRKFVASRGFSKHVTVVESPRGVVLRIKELVLFDTGSDDLREESFPILQLVAELFQYFDGTLSIEGHTDNQPISRGRFPSNWELSTARSTAVLRFLTTGEKALEVERMRVAGYADVRPLASNNTAAGRSQNRRVEFVFERSVKLELPGKKPRRTGFKIPFAQTN